MTRDLLTLIGLSAAYIAIALAVLETVIRRTDRAAQELDEAAREYDERLELLLETYGNVDILERDAEVIDLDEHRKAAP